MAQAVSEFQSLLGTLAEELQARIGRLLSSVSGLDTAELMAFITDAAPELLTPFITAAADLTTVWYDDQDPVSDFIAQPADLPADDALAVAARWAMTQADRVAAWSGAATKALFDTSRETVKINAAREGVRWARHAQPDACGFCRILATNGYFYTSEQAALAVRHTDTEGHDHCNCIAVPDRDGTYSPPDYIEQWKRDYKAARKAVGGNPGSIANAMDYLPGGRRYKGDDAPAHEPRPRKDPVNLDAPTPKQTKPAQPAPAQDSETPAQMAKRLLPGLEKSLENLRAQGLPEDSPQIQYHLQQIARWKRALAAK